MSDPLENQIDLWMKQFAAIDDRERVLPDPSVIWLKARVLQSAGATVANFLPQRAEEGYGLSPDGIARCLKEHKPQLLIAVDCGTSSAREIADLLKHGVETIVDGPRLIRLRTVLDGDNTIRVEVRDAGPGIKEPERIFEPFFTTKENGTGMGLAICRSIIGAHDGVIWAQDNPSGGAAFHFAMPAVTAAPA